MKKEQTGGAESMLTRRNLAAGAVGIGFLGSMALGGQREVAMSDTVFDVKALGAKGDGKADDTAAIQKALDAAGEVGSLEGDRLGDGVHGISIEKDDYRREDALRIERVKVARFSGDGIRMRRIWCFTIRQSMIAFNKGDGIDVEGWDGFLSDNWLSGNGGVGYGHGDLCSVTMTANRIEWNKEGGILLAGGSHYNIIGNYIDRSGKAGIAIIAGGEAGTSRYMTVTGNVIYRSGKHADLDTHDSSHVRIEGAKGITFVGNTMIVGRDDAGKGNWSPSYGIVLKGLENCIVKDNVLHDGALKTILEDLGGHGEGVIIKDNPGRLFKPE
ncbi:MAG: right-handed parallel beta-helix repeat-containing protein [Planctomycetota bacterium]